MPLEDSPVGTIDRPASPMPVRSYALPPDGNITVEPATPLGPSGTRETVQPPPVRLQTRGLDFFYGSTQALKNVNVYVLANCVTALIGPSGCGKSTFLRCLNRMNDEIPGTRVS